MAWESPRGPMSIDPQTRDVVSNIYIRKVEEINGHLYNTEFATFEAVKDPLKALPNWVIINRSSHRYRWRWLHLSSRMRLCRFGDNRIRFVRQDHVIDVTAVLDRLPNFRYPLPKFDPLLRN